MIESVKLPPEFESVAPTLQQKSNSRFILGHLGEVKARVFLESLGYQTFFQNIRCKQLEIDLVLLDSKHSELVFCEVKTRKNSFNPEDTISYKKKLALQKASALFVRGQDHFIEYRVDLVTVQISSNQTNINHFQHITW